MNDQEEDIQSQEGWSERPWRWVPDYVKYPAAVVGGVYRNLRQSVSKKKDPTLNKVLSTKETLLEMPNPKKNGKKKPGKPIKKRKKGRKIGTKKKAKEAIIAGNKRLGYNNFSDDVKKRFTTNVRKHKVGGNIRFGTGRMMGSLVITGRQRVGQITYSTSINTPCITFDSTARDDTIWPLSPTMKAYIGTPLFNIASCFQQFLFTKFSLEYDARCGTGAGGGLILTYVQDVDFLEGLGYSGTAPVLFEGTLSQTANAKSFPFWEDFRYTPNVLKGRSAKTYYTVNEYTASTNGFILDVAADAAQDRQCYQGMILVSGTGGGAGNNFLWGDVYLNYTLQLHDLSQPAITAIGPPPTMSRADLVLKRRLARLGVEVPERTSKEVKILESKDDVTVQHIFEDELQPGDPGLAALKLARQVSSGYVKLSGSRSSSKDRK